MRGQYSSIESMRALYLQVRTILGLTATAPESLTRAVAGHLGVKLEDVIRGPLLPGNLTLTVSRWGWSLNCSPTIME